MIEAKCPSCGAKLTVPEQYAGRTGKCRTCGEAVTVPAAPPPPVQPPPYPPYPPAYQQPAPSSGGMDGLIPTKNPSALIAYYLGVFSLIPCLGLLCAIPALILGIKGLKFANEHPETKGKAHAWAGIILGGLFTLIWGGLLIMMLVAGIANP